MLLLLPPFAAAACERPVLWRAERMGSAPRGGEGLAKVLAAKAPVVTALSPDHHGFLVFLLSQTFADEEQAIADLRSSPVFRFSPERGRSLLKELHDRGPCRWRHADDRDVRTRDAEPYAAHVSALREVSNR